MKTESKHSELPWHMTECSKYSKYEIKAKNIYLCEVSWDKKVNGDLIIKAVNNHYQLVETLKRALEYFDPRMDADDGIPNEEMNLFSELNLALIKAEENQ